MEGVLSSQYVDLILVSADSPCTSSYLEQYIKGASGVKVLLVGRVDRDQLFKYIAMGVRGLLCSDISLDLFKRASRVVCEGEVWFSRDISAQILRRFSTGVRKQAASAQALAVLSKREKQVLECAAQGLKNQAIAELLIISESTVKTHLYRVYEKLGVNNRLSAVLALKGSAW